MTKNPTPEEAPQQIHPLYAIDRDQVDAVLAHQGEPGPMHLTLIGGLISRYQDFPGAEDLKEDLEKCLRLWGLSRDELNIKTRKIWASGWRPGASPGRDPKVLSDSLSTIGSGTDLEDREG